MSLDRVIGVPPLDPRSLIGPLTTCQSDPWPCPPAVPHGAAYSAGPGPSKCLYYVIYYHEGLVINYRDEGGGYKMGKS